MFQRFLSLYAGLGMTNTEACFVLHRMDLGDVAVREYALRMGMSESAVRAVVRGLETKGLIKRNAQLGGPNSIQYTGGLSWLTQCQEDDCQEDASPRPCCG